MNRLANCIEYFKQATFLAASRMLHEIDQRHDIALFQMVFGYITA